jgi:Cu+-exporting ATPase
VDGHLVSLGSGKFVKGDDINNENSAVYVSIEKKLIGKFIFRNNYRNNIPALISKLKNKYSLAVLSGDNDSERSALGKIFGSDTKLFFQQGPDDKLEKIKKLQQSAKKVMMLGDGLNDAGALKQSDIGIAISDHSNNFTPASDAILEADQLSKLYKFIQLCKINKSVVLASFIISIIYNLVGIYFAVQGNLSPMIAAILMPASSLSILLITFGASNIAAWKMKLTKYGKP